MILQGCYSQFYPAEVPAMPHQGHLSLVVSSVSLGFTIIRHTAACQQPTGAREDRDYWVPGPWRKGIIPARNILIYPASQNNCLFWLDDLLCRSIYLQIIALQGPNRYEKVAFPWPSARCSPQGQSSRLSLCIVYSGIISESFSVAKLGSYCCTIETYSSHQPWSVFFIAQQWSRIQQSIHWPTIDTIRKMETFGCYDLSIVIEGVFRIITSQGERI